MAEDKTAWRAVLSATGRSSPKSRVAVAAKWTYAVLALALLFVLMPFLFWRATWFGRPLTDDQLAAALADTSHPRNIQHGLSQASDRIARGDPTVKRFYPQLLALAASPVPEIRTMDAWVMGGDNSSEEFHKVLLGLLDDSNPMVQRNAALGLVRFHDASGRAIIVGILKPIVLDSPVAGELDAQAKTGDALNPGTEIARIQTAKQKTGVQSLVAGRFGKWLVKNGATIASGQPIASILPDDSSVWEALRALYLIGEPSDLEAIAPYAQGREDSPPQIVQQARLTMEEIRSRSADAPAGPQ
ncbi:MAG TPA: biotin/lipoyl-containing protein [Candidatus Acidoferrales bacterium]|nr:biotin/lipoyl-containing protein [Candidatus Acidoferrales bacterium]